MTAASKECSPFGLIAAGIVGMVLDRKTRAKLERGDSPRSGERVWRNSYTEGQLEGRLWRPVGFGSTRGSKRSGRRFRKVMLDLATKLELRTREERQAEIKGARNGVLGDIGVAVLTQLFDMVDFATGRLEPAINTIADRLGKSYSAVHEALCRLRAQNFIQWIRRSRPTDNEGQAGPQVEQISNAYVLTVPPEMEETVRRLLSDGPVPDDASWTREQAEKDWKSMIARLTSGDFHREFWSGDRLTGERFKNIAAALDARDARELRERESSRNRETGGSF